MSSVLLLVGVGAIGVILFFGSAFLGSVKGYRAMLRMWFIGFTLLGAAGGFAWQILHNGGIGLALFSGAIYGAAALLFVCGIWAKSELQLFISNRRRDALNKGPSRPDRSPSA